MKGTWRILVIAILKLGGFADSYKIVCTLLMNRFCKWVWIWIWKPITDIALVCIISVHVNWYSIGAHRVMTSWICAARIRLQSIEFDQTATDILYIDKVRQHFMYIVQCCFLLYQPPTPLYSRLI